MRKGEIETYDVMDYTEVFATGMWEIEEGEGYATFTFYRETPDTNTVAPRRLGKIVAKVTIPTCAVAGVMRRFMALGTKAAADGDAESLAIVEAAGSA